MDSRVICDYLNFNARNGCPRGRKLYFMLKNTFQACKTCPNHPINVQKRPPFVFPYYVKTFQNQPINTLFCQNTKNLKNNHPVLTRWILSLWHIIGLSRGKNLNFWPWGFVIFCDLENGIRLNKQKQKTDATSLYQLLITSNFAFLSKKIPSL